MTNKKETQDGCIRIYGMTLQEALRIDREMMRECMPGRLEKADRIRPENGRGLSIAAGWLMLSVLGLKNENELKYTEKGKPYAPGYPLFNLSHSQEMAVMAVLENGSRHPAADTEGGIWLISEGIPVRDISTLGVDAEQIRERNYNVIRRAFTENEQAWLEEASGREDKMKRFMQIWTLKEAVMKADGRGLGMDPASFDVLDLKDGLTLVTDGRMWQALSLEHEGYMISVCWG